jgi:hypothetical protein
MSRHVIAREGMPSVIPGTWLDKGSLWIKDDEKIFVHLSFDFEHTPIGYATDLQRDEESGEVTVDIHLFNDEEVDNKLYECSFWATELEERRVEATEDTQGYRLILKARIRGIAILPVAANPRFSSQKLHGT